MAPQNRRNRTGRRRQSRSAPAQSERGWKGVGRRILKDIRRFLSSTTRLVLLIGALAGAVAAVIALLPKPADTNVASFSDVTAEPGVSLERYDVEVAANGGASFWGHRPSASSGTAHYRLAADASTAPKTVVESAAGADVKALATSSSTNTEALQGPSSESTSTSLTASILSTSTTLSSTASTGMSSSLHLLEPSVSGADVTEGTGAPAHERHAVIERMEASRIAPSERCLSPCETSWVVGSRPSSRGLNPIIDQELVSHSPTKAADLLASRFAHCRLQVDGHRQSPLGAMVTYNLDLDGFAGTLLTVSWSLESPTNGQEVPRCWWQEVSVERIRPTESHRSFFGEFWVPMPRRHGDYRIRLVLRDREGREYRSADSEPIIH